jgi:hypothetical protein
MPAVAVADPAWFLIDVEGSPGLRASDQVEGSLLIAGKVGPNDRMNAIMLNSGQALAFIASPKNGVLDTNAHNACS